MNYNIQVWNLVQLSCHIKRTYNWNLTNCCDKCAALFIIYGDPAHLNRNVKVGIHLNMNITDKQTYKSSNDGGSRVNKSCTLPYNGLYLGFVISLIFMYSNISYVFTSCFGIKCLWVSIWECWFLYTEYQVNCIVQGVNKFYL